MSKEKKVIDYYNSFSRDYNGFYDKIQFQKYRSVFLEEPKIIEWTIDHGGGTGLLSKWLRYPLITFDISDHMLRTGKLQNKELQCIIGDMNSLPFRNNSITQIYSFTALQNSSDPISAISEIWRTSINNTIHKISMLEKKFDEELFKDWLTEKQVILEISKLSVEDILLTIEIKKE